MKRRKKGSGISRVEEKDCWNLYSLQVLAPHKFINVVGNVLNGKYLLVGPKASKIPNGQSKN